MSKLAALLLVAMAARRRRPTQAALLERLRRGAVEERRIAAERLGQIGDDGATAELGPALRDPDAEVRSEAHDCAVGDLAPLGRPGDRRSSWRRGSPSWSRAACRSRSRSSAR